MGGGVSRYHTAAKSLRSCFSLAVAMSTEPASKTAPEYIDKARYPCGSSFPEIGGPSKPLDERQYM